MRPIAGQGTSATLTRTTLLVALIGGLMVPGLLRAGEDLEHEIGQFSAALRQAIVAANVKRVAISEFEDLNDFQSAFGQFLSDELTTRLAGAPSQQSFAVIERRQLTRVLKERKLSASSLFEPNTVLQVGRILKIDALVIGSIADLGGEVKINARIISIENGQAIGSAGVSIRKTASIQELMRQAGGVNSIYSDIPAGVSTQPVGASFQNEFVRIEVKSFVLSKGRETATLTLVVHNLTSADLLLALVTGIGGIAYGRATLTDEKGTSTFSPALRGLSEAGSRAGSREYFTTFPAKKRTAVLMIFNSNRPFSGSLFSLLMEWQRFEGESGVPFTVDILDLSPRG